MSGIIMGNVSGLGVATVTLSPASVAANTTAEQTFTVYRAALKIVAAALQEFSGMDLSRARVKLQKPPWMRPLEEVFPRD